MSTSIDRDSDEVSPDSPETILQKIAKVRNSREFKFNVYVAGAAGVQGFLVQSIYFQYSKTLES